MPPYLLRPHTIYKDSYLAAVLEFAAEGRNPAWNFDIMQKKFDEYVQVLLAKADDPMPGYVAQTDYWLIVASAYVGTIGLRHKLTPSLERYGGHIGYQIRPSMRRRGYGTLQLKLLLPHAWKRGLERVLITCDDDNIASAKIIEANGGVLLDKVDNLRPSLTRRYWIEKPSS